MQKSPLPIPDSDALIHSNRMRQHLLNLCSVRGGEIPFVDFMQEALYAPGLGYYSGGCTKLGAAGDFVTAPEISHLFSRTLALQAAPILKELGADAEILEVGAGRGVMAADILLELEQRESLPQRYRILELSPDLRQRQRQTLESRVAHLLERVEWLDGFPEAGFKGVVLANELLDAMPTHLLQINDSGEPEEIYVVPTEEGWREKVISLGESVLKLEICELQSQGYLAPGFRFEWNRNANAWVQSLGEWLEEGIALIIDYGFPRAELLHPQRYQGTLRCHLMHHAHSDPYLYPGIQDMTAHVDFTAIADAALAAGIDVRGFTSQGNFLLSAGIMELIDPNVDLHQQVVQNHQLQRLTLAHEMGEVFKVIALGRGIDLPLCGFSGRDDRFRL